MTDSKTRLLASITMMIVGIVFWTGCDKKPNSATGGGGGNASSGNGPAKVKPLICVSVLTLGNPFFKEMADAYQAEGAAKGFDVQVLSGETNSATQANQVQDFINNKAAAIILTPCNSQSIGTSIAAANKAGIPVFTADVATTDDKVKVVSHCATDNLEGGRVAGRAMVEMLGGTGAKAKIGIIDQPEVESAQMRERGFLEELAKAPGVVIVKPLSGGGNRAKANESAQALLQSDPDVAAIFAINDPMALGVLTAVESAGKAAQVKIIGFDGSPDARRAVKEGKMYGTVMQYPKKIASMTIDNIAKYMAGNDVPKSDLISPTFYKQSDAMTDPDLK